MPPPPPPRDFDFGDQSRMLEGKGTGLSKARESDKVNSDDAKKKKKLKGYKVNCRHADLSPPPLLLFSFTPNKWLQGSVPVSPADGHSHCD